MATQAQIDAIKARISSLDSQAAALQPALQAARTRENAAQAELASFQRITSIADLVRARNAAAADPTNVQLQQQFAATQAGWERSQSVYLPLLAARDAAANETQAVRSQIINLDSQSADLELEIVQVAPEQASPEAIQYAKEFGDYPASPADPVVQRQIAAETAPPPAPLTVVAEAPTELERTRLEAETAFNADIAVPKPVELTEEERTRLEAETAFNADIAVPEPVATNNPWTGVDAEKAAAWDNLSPADQEWLGNADPTDELILARAPDSGSTVAVTGPAAVDVGDTPAGNNPDEVDASPDQQQANEQAAAKVKAINQATLQSRYKQPGTSDWRVRLQLAPRSDYLYNASSPGILKPLAETNGVIFPYTPQVNTSYKANYEQYDLVHSNYRGVYYKNSRVDDVAIRGTFTAQDTREADYLLAVIHFFRSVTKMFYGKDTERGTPPPLVYLSGYGMNQFNGHPCVVSNFTYNLPDNVDYIRATNVNNYGTDLLSRRTATSAGGQAGLGATGNRILNAGLERFFPQSSPTADTVVGSVNNTQLSNYVPTKMEIDITLIPVQTRSQVSKQFSLKSFANGKLLEGGFW
jgi:hypothetical protein